MSEYSKESSRAGLFLFSAALRIRRSLINRYKRTLRSSAQAEPSASDELFLTEFYKVEKLLTVTLKELDGARPRLPFEGKEPRVMGIARSAAESGITESSVETVLKELPFTVLQSELELLKCCTRLALLSKLDGLLKRAPEPAELKKVLLGLSAAEELGWEELIRSASPVETLLRGNAGFSALDERSRAYCVEKAISIARSLGIRETEAARAAVKLAENGEGRRSHAAYFLAADGEKELRRELSPERPRTGPSPSAFFVLFIISFLALTALGAAAFFKRGALIAALAVFPSAAISLSAVTTVFGFMKKPKRILRLRVDNAVGGFAAAAAVPVLLTDEKTVREALDTLEAHYLANRLEGALFVLLGDLPDSDTKTAAGDGAIISAAKRGVEKLNDAYGERFFLLMRARERNADGKYGGHERKRGAVTALCRLLAGGKSEFSEVFPARELSAKYLAVLDADTIMPYGALSELIGAAAHPVNEPVVVKGKCVSGYSVFAPRMRTDARSAAKSFFARLAACDTGYELYSPAVSNLHMDLYGEGDFGGKGLLNIGAFLELTEGRIPDNAVLSHDLLEGSFARTAYLGDVVLYDGEPSTLPKWWKRRERWIRGDWQLLPFIFGKLGAGLKTTDRAKMLANLFASLREPALFLTAAIGAAKGSALLMAFALFALAFEPVKGFVLLAAFSLRERAAMDRWVLGVIRACVEITTLPYAAYMSLTAIVTAVYRTLVSHRNMLLWQTAAASKADGKALAAANAAAVLGFAALAALALPKTGVTDSFVLALLYSACFAAGPAVSMRIGRETRRELPEPDEKRLVMRLFLKGWRFFKEQCGETTNHLPPDNVQDHPRKPFADLTSPTDIGMGMTALVSAHDLGAVGDDEFVETAERMLASVSKLEKWHGIPFNWYRVTDLGTVGPRFVSSVDAGNLAASLAVLGTALSETGAHGAAGTAFGLFGDMELSRLYDAKRKLFRIGFNADEGRMTPSFYDLYASEARITSFIAVANGEAPKAHWQELSRLMKDAPGGRTLLSWSGTAFEYLMPLIFFETVPGSLQHEIALSAVRTQILNTPPDMPWGVSESGYYAFDRALNYQYRAFGEPSLALERRRARPRVAAPYASALALYLEPHEAMRNVETLLKLGASGRYGLFEAVDLREGRPRIVRSFMAHHKGMELASYAAYLTNNANARRFMSIPVFRAGEQLLFENLPLKPIVIKAYESVFAEEKRSADADKRFRPDPGSVGCALLSNGKRYAHVLTDGTGVSGIGGTMLTDFGGVRSFIGCGGKTEEIASDPVFSVSCAEFSAEADGVRADMEVFVAHSFDAEVRVITAVNRSNEEKTVRTGVFFRPVMASEGEFLAHPAFLRLSIDAEERDGAVFFRRRRRRGREELWLYAALLGEGAAYTSDAFTCPGRLSSFEAAFAEKRGGGFSKKPIEPCFGAVCETAVGPSEAKKLIFIMGAAESLEKAASDLEKLRASYASEKELSAASAGGLYREYGAGIEDAAGFGALAARIIKRAPYGNAGNGYRGRGVKALWELGISGDIPIVMIIADRREHIEGVRRFSRFAALAAARGLAFDAIVLSGFPTDYGDRDRAALSDAAADPVRVIDRELAGRGNAEALAAMALVRAYADEFPIPFKKPEGGAGQVVDALPPSRRRLALFNGFGGFDPETGEYVILPGDEPTPAPWCNILANERFGALVTENGGGFSWCGNSRLMRLTEWSCDPVLDPRGESVSASSGGREYLLSSRRCEVTHGFGYSVFRCGFEGIASELVRFTDTEKPLEYFLMRFKNGTDNDAVLRIRLRAAWTVGENKRPGSLVFGEKNGALTVFSSRNEFDGRYAFAASGGGSEGRDPVKDIVIPASGSAETAFIMGMADEKSIGEYAETLTDPARAGEELEKVKAVWRERLSALTVKTPDAGFDILVNGALLYQLYSSRLFAGTGFYQSGGAVGFRDRLQDSTALLLTDPDRARRILIDSAGMQFEEGDVLHWRHENGLGVRTRITDDRLFLLFAALEYALVTGDTGVWDEEAPFLIAPPLLENERERCAVFLVYGSSASLFEHCVRAVRISMRTGANGVPLMGTGDWNDGFDEVGGESCFNGWFLLYLLDRFVPVCEERGENGLASELRCFADGLRESMENTWEGDRYLRAIRDDGTKLGSKESDACRMDLVSSVWAVFCGAVHAEEAFDTALAELYDAKNGVLKLLAPPFTDEGGRSAGYIESYIEGVRENGGQYAHAAAWAVIAACMLGRAGAARELFAAIDPIAHGAKPEKYAVEPYAAAGDTGGCGELTGRGGWTWYTGAAGWLYTAAVRHILGIKKTGRLLKVEPVTELDSFEVSLRFGKTVYRIEASRGAARSCHADGAETDAVLLSDDGREHRIAVTYV